MINKRRKGMTLIEVLVAMAIIGIVAISMLSLFSTGFSFIVRAGEKSETSFGTHKQIEVALNSKDVDVSPSNLVLTFSSDNSTIESKGNIEVFSLEIGKTSTSITVFQPRY